MKKIAILISALILLSGCSMRIADLTVASTKNFNLNSGELTIGPRVTGKDNVAVILFPIGKPNLKTAIDRAVEKDRCAVGLSNVVLNEEGFVFIFGYIGISVQGDLIIDNNQPGCGGNANYVQKPVQKAYQPQPQTTQSYPNREQQIRDLESQNLPYAEYQRRYNEIMGQ